MEGLSVRINKLFIREQTGELCRDVQGVSAVYTIKSETNEKQIFQKNSTNTHTPPGTTVVPHFANKVSV